MNRRTRIYIICAVPLIALLLMFFVKPIPQDAAFHRFADSRNFFGIPNFWNVMSNLPFLLIAITALRYMIRRHERYERSVWVFFTGILFTSIGSAYYHLRPDNFTLVWDRLPMTIAFMSLFAYIVEECVDRKSGKNILPHLVFAGIFTVLYWSYTEQRGAGDLRFYALVQFLPLIMIPLILVLFPQKKTVVFYYSAIGIFYVVAKVFEATDTQVFEMIGFSGHSIKHLFAAMAPFVFYLKIRRRAFN